MKLSNTFAADAETVAALIARQPLALVFSAGAGGLQATPLPLLLTREHDDLVLHGHFARGNPQLADLQAAPRGLVVFMGEHAYISPSWLSDRSQAPTWNYATAQCLVEFAFEDRPEAALDSVRTLTDRMEREHARPWAVEELGPRLERLARATVPFRARVLETRAKFKLGQNENLTTLADILAALDGTGQHGLASRMREANAARLAAEAAPA